MADDLRYVRTSDGLHVAYEARGDGSIDVLEIGGFGVLFPLDAADEQPRWRRFEDRLRSFSRLIKFDLRGVGYSDAPNRPPSIDDWVADAVAVLDAVGAGKVSVLASSYGGFAALQLAAQHPDRVDKIVLANSAARFSWSADFPIGTDMVRIGEMRRVAEPDSQDVDAVGEIDVMAPSLSTDEDVRRWWSRTSRRGAGPAAAAAMWDIAATADVRTHVPAVQAPTLVLQSEHNRFVPPVHGPWLVEHLPDADLLIVPTADHLIWATPGNGVIDAIERFLTGTTNRASGTRTLTAIVFTDIVASTTHNSTGGDQAWLERLARHDQMAEEEIRRHGGHVVKRLGDGLLAVFPLASDAVRAAGAITDRAPDLDLAVRAGVHIAEVDITNDDVHGLGVAIAARVLNEAHGGEVLVTQAVATALAGSEHHFTDRGNHHLKGVEGHWQLSVAASPNAATP